MSEINWNKQEGGKLVKWDEAGKTLEGLLLRYDPKPDTGKGPGHLYEFKTKGGTVAFFAPTLLHKLLMDIRPGSIVQIKYTGESKTKVGNTLKSFEVASAVATTDNLKMLGIEVFEPAKEEADDGFGGM